MTGKWHVTKKSRPDGGRDQRRAAQAGSAQVRERPREQGVLS
jgi:hypothetical protein